MLSEGRGSFVDAKVDIVSKMEKQTDMQGKMTIAEMMQEMIAYSEGNIHDIDHFIRVWTYAKTIGEMEGLDEKTQFVLEAAAITHDIACPLCREKYGNTGGRLQEKEGVPLTEEFLSGSGLSEDEVERVKYLVGHHHTYKDIDGIDYQILVEADYIANATENGYGPKDVCLFMERFFKTEAGRKLLKSIFGLAE